jgi:hypothetical protein
VRTTVTYEIWPAASVLIEVRLEAVRQFDELVVEGEDLPLLRRAAGGHDEAGEETDEPCPHVQGPPKPAYPEGTAEKKGPAAFQRREALRAPNQRP